jgi:ATP-dependent Clp protease ATP-binding subunit ClpC
VSKSIFGRYTDHAKRAIFFARHEAQQFGAKNIDTEYLLLGLLYDSESRANVLFGLKEHGNSFRLKIEQEHPPSSPLPRGTDLPLSNASKRVLAYTAMEADELSSDPINTDHLVLGLLREEQCFAATLLAEVGLDLATARQLVAPVAGETPVSEKKTISPFIGIPLIAILLLAIYLVTKLALGK